MRRRRALAVSVVDGLVHAVMLGVSESYFGAIAVELGHSATNQGLLITVPVLAGAMSQLLAPALTHVFGSRKRFVVACAVLQALTHLWFIQIAESRTSALAPFMLAKILYFVGGNMMVPAWSAWMAELTVGPGRERYFALRSGANQAALLAGFVLAGHTLELTGSREALLEGYVTLFWVALAMRVTSSLCLASQWDPSAERPPTQGRRRLRIRHTLTHARWRVPLYITTLMFGANIAVPYFVPYWLEELKLGYREYTVLIGTTVLMKALTMPTFHRVSARFGMDRLLYAAGLTVAILPAAWAIMDSFAGYVVIQIVSGVAWGAVEYASFQLLLASSDEDVRLEFLSFTGSLQGIGSVAGSLVGSTLMERFGLTYITIFLLSAAVRALPLAVTTYVTRDTKR